MNFFDRVTAEALRANSAWKSAFLKGLVSFDQIFNQYANHFTRIERPVNALQLCRCADSIHTKNFVADFLQVECNLHVKQPFCVFQPPLRGLGATYDVHLRLIGKRIVDFLLVLIELFSIGVTAEALRANID